MKRLLFSILLTSAFLPATSFGAPDASVLEGKWLTKKTTEDGEKFVQTIEIKKNKFKFQVGDEEIVFR